MRLLTMIILLLVLSVCSSPQKQENYSNVNSMELADADVKEMSIVDVCTTYLVPPYLRAPDIGRHLFDTCIFKRDTIDFRGKYYYKSAYKMYPSNFKSCYANFLAVVYRNTTDSTWVLLSSPWENLAIVHTVENVTFYNTDEWPNPDSIEQVMALFKKSDGQPSAQLQREGVSADMAGTPWKCKFKKIYHEGGLDLKSIEFPDCSLYISYPYKLQCKGSEKRVEEGAAMLPPWLFYDFSNWFNYFTNDKKVRISHPDFSNFPGAPMSSLKAVRWDDERANIETFAPPEVELIE